MLLEKKHRRRLQTLWTIIGVITIVGMIILYIMPAFSL
jgi:hypothetical protein